MSISISIENRSHSTVRAIQSGELAHLGEFVMRLPSTYLMRGIDPWDDTVFNLTQMKIIREEIVLLKSREPDSILMLDVIGDAISEAIGIGGYIRFEGD